MNDQSPAHIVPHHLTTVCGSGSRTCSGTQMVWVWSEGHPHQSGSPIPDPRWQPLPHPGCVEQHTKNTSLGTLVPSLLVIATSHTYHPNAIYMYTDVKRNIVAFESYSLFDSLNITNDLPSIQLCCQRNDTVDNPLMWTVTRTPRFTDQILTSLADFRKSNTLTSPPELTTWPYHVTEWS